MTATIKDHGWQAFKARAKSLQGKEVAIGILGESAQETDGSDFRLVDVAVVNEFGSKDGHIPERPAHRETYETNKANVKQQASKAAAAIMMGHLLEQQGLNRLGLWYTGVLKQGIIGWHEPPNAPSTIAKKGADNPLIDTGRMVNSIQHEVRKAGSDAG